LYFYFVFAGKKSLLYGRLFIRATATRRLKRTAILSVFYPFGSAARSASALFMIWIGSAPNALTHISERGRLAAVFQQIYIHFA
jgi:hypothetical protein